MPMTEQDVAFIWDHLAKASFVGFPPCATCGDHVKGRDGELSVTFAATQTRDKEPIRWEWAHKSCATGRRFKVNQTDLMTPGLVMLQTDHLQRREWFWRSDWQSFVWSIYAPPRYAALAL